MSGEASALVQALIDESFCLTLIATRSRTLRDLITSFEPGALGISAQTVAALALRAERSRSPERNRAALEQFLLPLEIVAFGAKAAVVLASQSPLAVVGAAQDFGEARSTAAIAIAEGLEVLTCAPERYAGLSGVRLRILDSRRGLASPDQPMPDRCRTILAVGSHDLTLDLLGERLHAHDASVRFSTAHVGSLQGLLAVRRGDAHLAGTHLLDEDTGEYNSVQVRQILADHGPRAVLVGFVRRIQGIIVAAGNPRNIRTIDDMARDDVTIVNRQPGAGTRVLLDHTLRSHRLSPRAMRGYAHECYSHTAVAATVAAGEADCGLGIQAAANAHGLGFVPLVEERYDLLIPLEHYEGPLLKSLRLLIQQPDSDLLRAIHALGGYSTEGMGRVLAEY